MGICLCGRRTQRAAELVALTPLEHFKRKCASGVKTLRI
jgi:hypothetical protein